MYQMYDYVGDLQPSMIDASGAFYEEHVWYYHLTDLAKHVG